MNRIETAFEQITARARQAAGEARPSPEVSPLDRSPLAALHATSVSTGRTCDGIVTPGCNREATVEFVASGDPDSAGVYCGSCFARARFACHGRAWTFTPLPPA